MKKTAAVFVSALISTSVFSQDHAGGGVSIDPIGQNIAFAEAYDPKTGRPLTQVNKQVFGSPLLSDNWGNGQVLLQNGFLLKNMELQFDLYKNELHFRKNDVVYLFADSIKEFSMQFKDSLEMRAVVFRAGFPAVQKKTAASFYQVVAEGDQLLLLNYVTKAVREKYEYLGPLRKEYELDHEYFIYNVKAGLIKSITLKKSSLIKALPAYADSIQAFSDKNNYQFKTEAEVIELFKLLNR